MRLSVILVAFTMLTPAVRKPNLKRIFNPPKGYSNCHTAAFAMSPAARRRPAMCFDIFLPTQLLCFRLNLTNGAGSVTSPKIALSTLFTACLFSSTGAVINNDGSLKTTHTESLLSPRRGPCHQTAPDCPWPAARLVSHLSFSRGKWSLTRAALALNPPGIVLKRHRSNVDRNTFIGIVSPFKRQLGGGGASRHRSSWRAGRPFDLLITCAGEPHTWQTHHSLPA